jgi:hypothetical protein
MDRMQTCDARVHSRDALVHTRRGRVQRVFVRARCGSSVVHRANARRQSACACEESVTSSKTVGDEGGQSASSVRESGSARTREGRGSQHRRFVSGPGQSRSHASESGSSHGTGGADGRRSGLLGKQSAASSNASVVDETPVATPAVHARSHVAGVAFSLTEAPGRALRSHDGHPGTRERGDTCGHGARK